MRETASWSWSEAQTASPSLVVLPFETFGEMGTDAFAQGLHDELITRLSNISGFRVIARTSVRPYDETRMTPGEIARQTGADWILEGHVRVEDEHVRAGARLTDSRSSEQTWSGQYRRVFDTERVLHFQAELANDIAESLKTELTRSGA